jgi:type III secretion protein U
MSGARTEQPTPRRLREARRRGDVPRGLDLSATAALAGGLGGLVVLGPGLARMLARAIRAAVAGSAGSPFDPAQEVARALALVVRSSFGVGACALAAGALAATLQHGPGFFAEALRPRLERLDPVRGLRRLASAAQLGRAALALGKAAVLIALLCGWWRDAARELAAMPRAAPGAALAAGVTLLGSLAVPLVAALAALAILDLALERRRVRRSLMMTREEVRREQREDEGDPERKADHRRVHRALLEAGPVERATVVVVNPTHVAVALRHDRGGEGAPRVVA